MIPKVVVVRDREGAQTVRRVTIDGVEVRVSSIEIHRGVDGPATVTIALPAEYVEEDA